MASVIVPIGQLRHRVTIQAPVRTSDGQGGWIQTWQTVPNGTVWAHLVPLAAREQWYAQQLAHRVTHRVVLRYRADLTASHRLVMDGRVFRVVSVVADEARRRTLTLLVEEGRPD